MKQMQLKHWQDPVLALLGVWFAVTPWVLGIDANTAVLTACLSLGAALLLVSVAAIFDSMAWEHWLAGAIGLGALASPWLFGFSGLTQMTANAVAVGLATIVLAAWVLAEGETPGGGLGHDRMAH